MARIALLSALALIASPALAAGPATKPVVSRASANVRLPARPLPGINVSGCEFTHDNTAKLCPKPETIDAYADMGFRAMRIPVMSRQLDAAIPLLKPTVAEAQKRGVLVSVDLQDYLPLDASRIVPLIRRVAAAFGPNVWIDYDNEPKGPTGATGDAWVAAAAATNDIIAGARAAGIANVLVVEWPGYSGDQHFLGSENIGVNCYGFACGLDRVGGLKDPVGKTVLGPHRYYDKNKSGTNANCDPTTGAYWTEYFEAAEQRGYKTLIGETAYGNVSRIPAQCALAASKIIPQINASKLTIGYMIWGGGASWNARYLFLIPPTSAAASSAYVQQVLGR